MLLIAMSMVSGNYISDIKNEKKHGQLSQPSMPMYSRISDLFYSILIVYCHGERITLNF